MDTDHKRLNFGKFWIATCLLSACSSVEGPPVANQEASIQPRVKLTNGVPLIPGSQFADDVVITKDGCRGTLLTNSWVLSAMHCEWAYKGDGQPDFVYVYTEPQCTSDADCHRLNTQCKSTPNSDGNRCVGPNVLRVYRNPAADPGGDPGLGDQVDLWQLEAPISSEANPVPHSIAQQIWYGDKDSLLHKPTTILGHCGHCSVRQTLAMEDFTIFDISSQWSYSVSSSVGGSTESGDSGGPGYFYENGVYYLTGMTMVPNNQHDLVESFPDDPDPNRYKSYKSMYGWIDDTLFDVPRMLTPNTQALAMALTPTGAVQTFLSGDTYYVSFCDAEPCDSRGKWSTPGWTLRWGTGYPPAIAVEADGTTAEVVVPQADGVWVLKNTEGAFLGTTNIGGICTGPAAVDSRPGTSPSILDVVCMRADQQVWIAQREQSIGWKVWYSLGAPTPGVMPGTVPAVVSPSAIVTHVFVVGRDGRVWYTTGTAATSGWSEWTPLVGSALNLRSVAATSYDPSRIDVVAVDASGKLQHKIWAGNWSQDWTQITRGLWNPTVAPFAASYSGKLGLLNVGGIASGASTAYIQRYSDWTLPQTNITSPVSGATFTEPADVTITAEASDSYGTITKMEFYQGAVLIGADTTAPYSIIWPKVLAGSYTLSTTVYDDLGASNGSPPLTITVNPDALFMVLESNTGWSASTGVLDTSDIASQGAHSLAHVGGGYSMINSPGLSTLQGVTTKLAVDLRMPSPQPNPYWYGALQLYFSIPSQAVYNQYVGQVELTGLPLNKFNTLTFTILTSLVDKLKTAYSDLTISLALNVPSNSNGKYLIDNMRFVQ